MGRGCVAIGMKGVYMGGGGTTGFVEQVAIERVPGYVEALRRAYGWVAARATELPAAADLGGGGARLSTTKTSWSLLKLIGHY